MGMYVCTYTQAAACSVSGLAGRREAGSYIQYDGWKVWIRGGERGIQMMMLRDEGLGTAVIDR